MKPTDGGYPDDHILFSFNPNIANGNNLDTLTFEMYVDGAGQAQTEIYWDAGGSLIMDPNNSPIAGSIDGTNWNFEAALKWTDIVGDSGYTPSLGDKFGTSVLLCDNDVDDDARDVFLIATNNIGDPTLHLTVTLTSGLVCGDNGYQDGDLTDDCEANLSDFAEIAEEWLMCTDPKDESCLDLL